jgi:D-sedoheptulose 7-phosphate isomerase
MNELINERFKEHLSVTSKTLIECQNQIIQVANTLTETLKSRKKILICGNGGSAADAQHFAAELVSSFSKDIKRRGLPAIALTTDSSILTAFSNDFGFEGVFARQVNALGFESDCLVALSTSGNSKNCLLALEEAKSKKMKTVSFLGQGGKMKNQSDYSICIPSSNTQNIQEMHILAYHIISELIEKNLFK